MDSLRAIKWRKCTQKNINHHHIWLGTLSIWPNQRRKSEILNVKHKWSKGQTGLLHTWTLFRVELITRSSTFRLIAGPINSIYIHIHIHRFTADFISTWGQPNGDTQVEIFLPSLAFTRTLFLILISALINSITHNMFNVCAQICNYVTTQCQRITLFQQF